MAEEQDVEDKVADDVAEGDAAEAGLSQKKKLLIAAGAAVALLLVGGGSYFVFFKKKSEVTVNDAGKPAVFYDLPEVVVNLGGTDRPLYLKVKIALELPNDKAREQVTPVMPRVLDAFQTYMRELRPSDIEGSAGIFRLKEELLRRVNTAVYPAKVDSVLFKEFVVQ